MKKQQPISSRRRGDCCGSRPCERRNAPGKRSSLLHSGGQRAGGTRLLRPRQGRANGQANPETAVRHHRRSVHRDLIPFQGDGPGHFRSPDIGAAILEVSSRPIDTKQMEIMVSAAGYQTIKVAHIPRQSKGAVELDVRMEPKANADSTGASASTAAASQPGAAGGGSSAPTDSSKPTFFLLAACFGLAAISAVARTVGRPESTER